MSRTMLRSTLLTAVLCFAGLVSAQDNRARTELGENADRGMIVQVLQQAPAGAGAEVSVALPVNFEFGSAALTAQGQSILKVTAQALNAPELVSQVFLVEGHTDAVGGDQANLVLSQQRADAARSFLIAQGVNGGRLTAIGYGKTRLIGGVAATDARQRRVEFVRRGA